VSWGATSCELGRLRLGAASRKLGRGSSRDRTEHLFYITGATTCQDLTHTRTAKKSNICSKFDMSWSYDLRVHNLFTICLQKKLDFFENLWYNIYRKKKIIKFKKYLKFERRIIYE
jgi:hypothetical protein